MEKQNKICICMLYYNSSEFVWEAIESIKNQTYKNWELYIYDDGSKVQELNFLKKILNELEGKYTLIAGKHKKQYYGRSKLFSIVEGDIVLTLDSDDAFTNKNFFVQINNEFNKHKFDILYFNYTDNRKTKVKKSNTLKKIKTNGQNQIEEIKEEFCSNWWGINALWDKAISAKIIEKIPFESDTKIKTGEDRLLLAYILKASTSLYILDEINYYYRCNPKSVTKQIYTIEYFENRLYVENKIIEITSTWHNNNTNINNMLTNAVFNYDMYKLSNSKATYKYIRDVYRHVRKNSQINNFLNSINRLNNPLWRKILLYLFKWKLFYVYYLSNKLIHFISCAKSRT